MTSLAVSLALIVTILGLLFAAWRAVLKAGADGESIKRVKANLDAKVDELEMNREATNIERANAALSDIEARAKAKRVVR